MTQHCSTRLHLRVIPTVEPRGRQCHTEKRWTIGKLNSKRHSERQEKISKGRLNYSDTKRTDGHIDKYIGK
jgi:hypothetical protein